MVMEADEAETSEICEVLWVTDDAGALYSGAAAMRNWLPQALKLKDIELLPLRQELFLDVAHWKLQGW